MGLGIDNRFPDVTSDAGPEHFRRVRRWTSPRGEVDANLLSLARGTPLAPDTTRLGYTVDSVQVIERDTATMWFVTNYLKPKVLGAVGNLSEIARRTTRRTLTGDYGVRIFEGTDSTVEADTLTSLPIGEVWPGSNSAFAARLYDLRILRNHRGTIARVEADYRPFSGIASLCQTPGKGLLMVDIGTVAMTQDYEPLPSKAKQIRGMFTDTDGMTYRYIAVTGPAPLLGKPACELWIQVVFVDPNIPSIMALAGKINSGPGPGGAAKDTLLFHGGKLWPIIYRGQQMYIGNLRLSYLPEGWTNCMVQKQKYIVQETPVLDSSGNPTGAVQRFGVWVNTTDAPEARAVALEADFASINALVST